jgi:molybdopterin-containing oxidoreductase family iron-sulfur binding subunit
MLDVPPLIDRRRFLQLMSASLALANSACARRPLEPIVPYANQPEGMLTEQPEFYATALTQGGYAHGVLVENNMGRPTKVEGNPAHPASLGATGPIEQGRILELWDPERSHALLRRGEITTWDSLTTMLVDRLSRLGTGGESLRVLSRAVSSPTLLAQWQAVQSRYPGARLHQYEPVNRDNVHEGARRAFGRALEPVYHFDRARVVVSLEADFLGTLPGHVRYARDFMRTRRPEDAAQRMGRLYVTECMPSISGATADHRLPMRSGDIAEVARQLAAGISGKTIGTSSPWLSAAAADLLAHRGESLVLAGDEQPPEVHALAHQMNRALGNLGRTVDFIVSPLGADERNGESLRDLVSDMNAGRVGMLVILGSNPVYDAPVDLEFAAALARVSDTIHWGLYVDETARSCEWHVPAAHELESWSDARAFDGTLTIQQPLIAPLYGGRSAHELVAALAGDLASTSHDIVRATWSRRFGAQMDERWHESLRTGVVANTAAPFEDVSRFEHGPAASPASTADNALELAFRPDSTLWDGRYATNAWLQELPKALTQLTWDNAAMLSPVLASQLGVANEDVIELSIRGRRLEVPVWIVPGHATRGITVHLGSGRTHAGVVGSNRGFNAYALRETSAPWFERGLVVRKVGRRYALATVQHHHRMMGRDIVRSAPLATYLKQPDFARAKADRKPADSLYPRFRYDGYAWGMSIDLSTCIGCNACTIACQAENNIPTVGKEEVLNGREMHWIRVDRYEEGEASAPRTHFQPVPCMQCEQAPCEVVCPVEASVHDAEGINVQVYNRCVGTRFCSNNCPYKVRRFNFLSYAKDDPSLNAQRNPEVTVRMRGVMEKCNYCLQRVVRGRITADRENRTLRDGEVVTACQAVCPTQAIVFGDLNNEKSQVRAAKASPRSYALLGELNTRPRTTYLAKVVNPRPTEDEES